MKLTFNNILKPTIMEPKNYEKWALNFNRRRANMLNFLYACEDEDNMHSSIELVDSTTDTSEREFCGETTEDAEFEIIS